jgi:hypothetical protein
MNIHARLLLAGALSLCGFTAQAQSAPEPVAPPQVDTQDVAQARVDDPHCLRYTGSLVVAASNAREDRNDGTQAQSDAADAAGAANHGRCVYSSGRAYSQDDLRRTGQTDIGRALQMLDPSVTIGH